MIFTKKYKKTTYFIFALVWLFTATPVFARTVPVAEIIKTFDTSTTPNIDISDTEFNDVFQSNNLKTWAIAEKPMFMEHAAPFSNNQSQTKTTTTLDPYAVYSLVQKLSPNSHIDSEDAKFVLENNRVIDFSPGKNGFFIDYRLSSLVLVKNPPAQHANINLTGLSTPPNHALSSTNTFGIKEFIAGGISDFSNSSRNRLANIEAGMNQVKGVLVKPGDIFSFGEYLGDVTAEKGFKPEIVIKADGLKPELGGGICQVSSTLFRAVMQSGMQVTQRKNHAFSVSHYYPAGTDATIYTPVTDLKFKNDTPAHILIWPYYLDKTHLAFDLYGTSDGRDVVVDEPIHTDRKADGSLKASWTRHVTIQGVTREDTFKSNYLPPALFKKEEKFVVAEPTITPTPITAPSPTPSPST